MTAPRRSHDRPPAGHRLQHGNPAYLLQRGGDEDIARGQLARTVLLTEPAVEDHVRVAAKAMSLRGQPDPFPAIADDVQAAGDAFPYLGEGVEQDVDGLPADQPAHEQETGDGKRRGAGRSAHCFRWPRPRGDIHPYV